MTKLVVTQQLQLPDNASNTGAFILTSEDGKRQWLAILCDPSKVEYDAGTVSPSFRGQPGKVKATNSIASIGRTTHTFTEPEVEGVQIGFWAGLRAEKPANRKAGVQFSIG